MKVAVVHDWINSSNAGAPRVALAILEEFPGAPIYTSIYEPEKAKAFNDYDVRTSFIQKSKLARKHHQYFPILRQKAFEKFDFSDFDVVISSSGSEAKGIITKPSTLHITYCHAPTHYYWRNYEDYLKNPGFGALNPLARIGLKLLIGYSRKWDLKAANRPDAFIANSTFIKGEIKKYYNRESTVIHPPVNISRFPKTTGQKRKGLITVGRQVPFKKIDLAVKACSELGIELTVIGNGSEHERLKAMAGPTVAFKTGVSDEELSQFFSTAEGFIFPSEDDFGIVAAESHSAGTPVIAYGTGGSRDIVEDGKSGVFFDSLNVESLKETLKKFQAMEWDYEYIQASSKRFSQERFAKELRAFVDQQYAEHQKKQAKR